MSAAISRNEDGDLVIHPVPPGRGTALLQALQLLDDALTRDLVPRLGQGRLEQSPDQEPGPL